MVPHRTPAQVRSERDEARKPEDRGDALNGCDGRGGRRGLGRRCGPVRCDMIDAGLDSDHNNCRGS